MVRQAKTQPRPKRLSSPEPVGQTETIKEQADQHVVTVTPSNRAVFFPGWKIALPINCDDRQLCRTVAADQLAYWYVIKGDMVLAPLPIVAMTGSKKFVNSYNIQGVWSQDPPRS